MSALLMAAAAARFGDWRGTAPAGTVFAPGRVNLIGEHVDYNDGLVLPMPIAAGTAVSWARRNDGLVRVLAADFDQTDEFAVAAPDRPAQPAWPSYVRGMVAALRAHQPDLSGADLVITGNLPQGAGVSSSASLCVSVGRALLAASGAALAASGAALAASGAARAAFGAARAASGAARAAVQLAQAAQSAEHHYAGVACGIMDQMAVAAGLPGHAMLLDCRSLEFSQHPLPPAWRVVLIDSGTRRGLMDGEYNLRRAQCEAAARAIGVAALRDAVPSQLAALAAGSAEHRRAAHVVAEIGRVQAAAAALDRADLPAMAAILRAGHISLRDLFEVSLPGIDRLVAQVDGQLDGAGAARLTGAGFGGSVVAVLPRGYETALAAAIGQEMATIW